MKIKLEYIWLDGYEVQNIRSKIKVIDSYPTPFMVHTDYWPTIEEIPDWSFDGSSTKQADGSKSDCILKPQRIYNHPCKDYHFFILCEVFNADGTPHTTNKRWELRQLDSAIVDDYWISFEQEYFIYDSKFVKQPLGWNSQMEKQGKYYCGVGTSNVSGRILSEEHLDLCIKAGIGITGTNAEVAKAQWEYQVFQKDALRACDDLIVGNYILMKHAERYDLDIELHPKPVKGDWNGSGCHINFSTRQMRDIGGKHLFYEICDTLGEHHEEHMVVYGKYNHERLTGLHETQHHSKFSYGISDRGASIRIPIHTVENNWKGYLEDRRPSSNLNPYAVTSRVVKTLENVFNLKNKEVLV